MSALNDGGKAEFGFPLAGNDGSGGGGIGGSGGDDLIVLPDS
jgi:hypothetical protein